MTIWDSPIFELFGCQPGYLLNQNLCPPGQGFHNGVDYGCSVGTDITVNGVVIGKSGATGTVTGPHCHVGHWKGGKVEAIGPQDGKNVNGAVVSEVSSDPVNGKFVRVADADGSSWVYLHMSVQLVNVGQKLEEGEDMLPPDQRYMTVRIFKNAEPTADQVSDQTWADTSKAITALWNTYGKDHYYATHNPDGSDKPTPTQGFTKVGTIDNIGDVFKKG